MLTKTLKVFFRRGDAQGIAFQESIDSSYRELYNKEQVLIINDNGSGSISKPRPAIDELIKLIEQDSVDTIYTFDRTRLFRDFYYSQHFARKCKQKNVKVILTNDGKHWI